MKQNKNAWMQKLASIHALNEAATKGLDAKSILESWGNMHMNPDANFAGMGDPTLPQGSANPDGTFTGITNDGNFGSGDMPSSTLPMAMAIAAQTIALDLLPTVPISTALTILPYVNGVYSGGATNRNLGSLDTSAKNPRLVKGVIDWDATLAIAGNTTKTKNEILEALKGVEATITIPGAGADPVALGTSLGAKVTFTGLLSFYDKAPIFEIVYPNEAYRNGNFGGDSTQDGSTFANIFNQYANGVEVTITPTGADPVKVKISYFDTVKTYEDFVPFFTGVSKYGSNGDYNTADGTRGAAQYNLKTLNPYLRSEGEVTPANTVSLEMASTKVDAKTIKIKGEITREQFQDMTAYGYDPYGFINAILTNECTQRINFDILKALHTLGKKHADSIGLSLTSHQISFQLVHV